MNASIQKRLDAIERRVMPRQDEAITLRFAHLRPLPPGYIGERHTVVKGEPSSTPDTECEIEERPGPGCDLPFDPATLLVVFVPSPTPEPAIPEAS